MLFVEATEGDKVASAVVFVAAGDGANVSFPPDDEGLGVGK